MKKLSFISLCFLILSPVFAANVNLRNKEIHEYSPERRARNEMYRKTFKLRIFQDSEISKEMPSGEKVDQNVMNPADAIIDPLSLAIRTGDLSFRTTADKIFAVKTENGLLKAANELFAEIPMRVVETLTNTWVFFYLTHGFNGSKADYQKYISAKDYDLKTIIPNDAEGIIWKLNKSSPSDIGVTDYVYSNAGGFPQVYSPNLDRQEKVRARVVALLEKDSKRLMGGLLSRKQAAAMIFMANPSAQVHDSASDPKFEKDASGEFRLFNVFVSRSQHHIFGGSPVAWAEGNGEGYTYVCTTDKCSKISWCPISDDKNERILAYSAIDWDEFYLKYFPPSELLSPADQAEAQKRAAAASDMFDETIQILNAKVDDGKIKTREGMPSAFAARIKGQHPEANLPDDWSARTLIHNHSMPHLIARDFDPDLNPDMEAKSADKEAFAAEVEKKISSHYLFNLDIEYVE